MEFEHELEVELDVAALELLPAETALTGCPWRTECVAITCIDADSRIIT